MRNGCKWGKDTHGTTGPESGTRGMRGSNCKCSPLVVRSAGSECSASCSRRQRWRPASGRSHPDGGCRSRRATRRAAAAACAATSHLRTTRPSGAQKLQKKHCGPPGARDVGSAFGQRGTREAALSDGRCHRLPHAPAGHEPSAAAVAGRLASGFGGRVVRCRS